ncbi:manganese-binding transcriptional regulator MntR [Rhizosaccharibacter radicis]|uniref:Manganese-binding transcriptional regulator MntR n=1 Tax=Rhizosaccharibacter radicis TaxID=2782605 RepID=A0ABT1VZM2_9PROT|nr:manganese-binding transcriptional regulator MntR [Acetobacteraceae bacterium KSS12]
MTASTRTVPPATRPASPRPATGATPADCHPSQADHLQRARNAQARILLEDYVELIDGIAGPDGLAGPSAMARQLGVSHASAIKCIARLVRAGLATSLPYKGVALTEAGRAMAERVRRRHRLVVSLLRAVGVPEADAEADAEGIEHHVSDTTLLAFERFLVRRPLAK